MSGTMSTGWTLGDRPPTSCRDRPGPPTPENLEPGALDADELPLSLAAALGMLKGPIPR